MSGAGKKEGKKLFLTDLDGTLLNDSKQITEETMEALREFAAKGNVFAICTGRAVENALDVQKELGLTFPGSYAVGYNGAHIYDYSGKRTLYRKGMELSDVREILELAEQRGIHCQGYFRQYIVAKEYNECMAFYRRVIHSPVIITDHVMDEFKEEPCKLLAMDLTDHEKLVRLKEDLEKRFSDKYIFLFSNPAYLEMFVKDAGKGTALLRIARELSIPIENTYAAGDQENDISMIEAAGVGIAMKNATEQVKTSADVITDLDNNHGGLASFIRRMTEGSL